VFGIEYGLVSNDSGQGLVASCCELVIEGICHPAEELLASQKGLLLEVCHFIG
jgi:hypothetical protein